MKRQIKDKVAQGKYYCQLLTNQNEIKHLNVHSLMIVWYGHVVDCYECLGIRRLNQNIHSLILQIHTQAHLK
jgi:hypothetical protein